MKRRLNNLEAAVSRVEDVIEADQRIAETVKRIWRYEYQSQLSDEDQEHIMRLAREVHAGNPEVAAEVEELIAEEAAHRHLRAVEYVEGLTAGERQRWSRLLGVSEAP